MIYWNSNNSDFSTSIEWHKSSTSIELVNAQYDLNRRIELVIMP